MDSERAWDSNRVWRRDRGALLSGVCAGLAEDLDLPLPVVRAVAVIFMALPTGLAYFALALLLRARPVRHAARPAAGLGRGEPPTAPRFGQFETRPAPKPNFALLAHRFEALEPRLKRIEAFVTSSEFELQRDFRRMDE